MYTMWWWLATRTSPCPWHSSFLLCFVKDKIERYKHDNILLYTPALLINLHSKKARHVEEQESEDELKTNPTSIFTSLSYACT